MKEVMVKAKIPDGYELACDEMRPPKEGEWHMTAFDVTGCREASRDGRYPSIIVRPAWQWPSWLKCDWVARNSNGSLTLGNGRPMQHDKSNWWSEGGASHYWVIDESFVDIDFPRGDWRQSLRLNPNREAKQ